MADAVTAMAGIIAVAGSPRIFRFRKPIALERKYIAHRHPFLSLSSTIRMLIRYGAPAV